MERGSQGKRWVFDELVEDRSTDIQGLVAYALYKANKADIAKTKREQGLSEEAIVAEVSTFHQNAVNSRSMLARISHSTSASIAPKPSYH